MPPLTVIISGCHSGPNPSPGLGVARSLGQAFPEARLIGRDFSPLATGIHAEDLDEAWICPPWEEAELELAWRQLQRRLESAWMVPGLDLEVRWLGEFAHPRILSPPSSALRLVAKPAIAAGHRLPVRIPNWLPVNTGDREVERFCRGHGWQVWLKGPAYESRAVGNWKQLQSAGAELGAIWGDDGLFVQAHVPGEEVSVAFAAFQGELLDAVFLEKRGITPEGKAWGGLVQPVPNQLYEALRTTLQDLEWTGGGELEFIRNQHGELWLFDWNPRFPAWVHGATLAGHNLPAALVVRATGIEPAEIRHEAEGFVRVVVEIPWRMPLPPAATARRFGASAGKHPSGMPQLRRRLELCPDERPVRSAPPFEAELERDLLEAASAVAPTPSRVLLRRTATKRFRIATQLAAGHPRLQVAYSIKTNPASELMALALQNGLLAEAISCAEIEWAIRCGWPADRIVYNGPVPLEGLFRSTERLHAAFADDVCSFARYVECSPAQVVGVRLRPPFVSSRFGVPVERPEEFEALVPLFDRAPAGQKLGVSFHIAGSDIGLGRWEGMALSLIGFAAALEKLTGRSLSLIDLGGGWTPEDFEAELEPALRRLIQAAEAELAGMSVVLIEPGKALAEPAQAVLTRVIHIRHKSDGRRSVVLDAGIGDVPLVAAFPHRMALVRGEGMALGPGIDSLLGPTCMEGDIVAQGIELPPDLAVGDLFAICDAGAYDASTSFSLGRGAAR